MVFRTTCAILPRVLLLLRPRPTLTCRHLRLEGCNGCSVLAHTQPQASSWLEGSCSCIHLFHGARPSRSLGCGLAVDVDHSFHPRIVSTRSTTSTTSGPHSLMGPGVFGVLAQSVLARRSVWTLHACPPPMHRTHALHACTARCSTRMPYTHALPACTARTHYTQALHACTARMHCTRVCVCVCVSSQRYGGSRSAPRRHLDSSFQGGAVDTRYSYARVLRPS